MVQRPRPDLRGGCAAMRIPTVTGVKVADVNGEYQIVWGQRSRHRQLNVQTPTSNVRSPFKRKTVLPLDPTQFGTPAHGRYAGRRGIRLGATTSGSITAECQVTL